MPVGRGVSPPSITRWVPTTYGELGWPQVDAIQQQAQRGMTMRFVDLTRRMLRSDSHMLSCYETRVDAVAGAPYAIKPPAGVSPARKAMAELAADDCTRALGALDWENVSAHLLDATFLGYAVAEIIWTVRSGMVWPSEIILHHPRRFQFADDFSLYVYDQGYASPDAKYNSAINALGPPLDRDKFIVHTPASIPDYPTQAGIFYALIRPWWVKSWGLKYWLAGAENAGNPRLVGTLSQNADHETRESFATAINALSADAQCIVNEGASLQFLDGAGNVGPVWQDLIGTCDASISKLTLGSTLNVEIGESGGNRAASESQDATTIVPRLERDQRMLWKTIERCLFEPFLRFNLPRYGGTMPDVPVGASEIVRQKAEIDDLIVKKGAVTYDELRTSRGLEAWGAQAGGEIRIPAEVEGFAAEIPVAAPAPGAVESVAVDAPAEDVAEDVASQALNGAQVTALQGLLASVQTGELAAEAAIIAIASAFPSIPESRVRAMVTAQAGQHTTPSAEPGVPALAPSSAGGAGSVDPFPRTARAAQQVASRAASASSQRKRTP